MILPFSLYYPVYNYYDSESLHIANVILTLYFGKYIVLIVIVSQRLMRNLGLPIVCTSVRTCVLTEIELRT